MKVSRLAFLFSLILTVVIASSGDILPICGARGHVQNQEDKAIARKFDEFTPSFISVTKYRLDLFYNKLLTLPDAQAYVIFYRSRRGAPTQNHSYARNYLEMRGGIPPERIKAIYGGYRQNPIMELWIVPKGAELPKPSPTYGQAKRKKH